MSAPAKLAAFVVVLAALFGAGALAGDLIGSDRDATAAPLDDHPAREAGVHNSVSQEQEVK